MSNLSIVFVIAALVYTINAIPTSQQYVSAIAGNGNGFRSWTSNAGGAPVGFIQIVPAQAGQHSQGMMMVSSSTVDKYGNRHTTGDVVSEVDGRVQERKF